MELLAPAVRRAIEGKIDARWRSLLSEDDVMQQTFADAFMDINRLDKPDLKHVTNWLIRLAKNNLTDAVRHLRAAKTGGKARQQNPGSDESYFQLMGCVEAGTSTPSVKVARREVSQQLSQAIDLLPPAYQLIIRCYDLEGQSADDVAKELGCSVGAMYMRRNCALNLLGSLLENPPS